jgi:hypothetical protein
LSASPSRRDINVIKNAELRFNDVQSDEYIAFAKIQIAIETLTYIPNTIKLNFSFLNEGITSFATIEGILQTDAEEGGFLEILVKNFDCDNKTITINDFNLSSQAAFDSTTGFIGFRIKYSNSIFNLQSAIFGFDSELYSCSASESDEIIFDN